MTGRRGKRRAATRRETVGARRAVATAVVLATLAFAGCSTDPAVEEVIPRGQVPQDEAWCQMLSTEQIDTLLGGAGARHGRTRLAVEEAVA